MPERSSGLSRSRLHEGLFSPRTSGGINYQKLPKAIRRAFGKQLVHLLRDIRHPSLRAKRYDERGNLWQARVTRNWRFYFEIKIEMYVLHEIHKHAD